MNKASALNNTSPLLVINGSFLAQPLTGVQRFAIEICRRLLKQHAQAELVAPCNLHHTEDSKDLSPRIVGKLTGHLWEQLELWWYVRRRGALLLNLDMKGPLLYRRKLITIHDLNFLHNPQWVSHRFYCLYRLLVSIGSRTSQQILTVSRFSQQEITRYLDVPTERITVIYNAVSPRKTIVTKRVVKEDYLLSVASADPRKNLSRLIRAFRQLKRPDVRLVLVGLPRQNATTEEAIDENILFLGYVDEVTLANLYQHATAFVYPSLYEGFGIPPLEAMRAGCPVVVANSSSLPEVCGDAAHYVDPTDEHSIVEGLRQILDDSALRKNLVSRGYQRVRDFSWDQSVEALLKLLTTLEARDNN